jgi:hypothetical protein
MAVSSLPVRPALLLEPLALSVLSPRAMGGEIVQMLGVLIVVHRHQFGSR